MHAAFDSFSWSLSFDLASFNFLNTAVDYSLLQTCINSFNIDNSWDSLYCTCATGTVQGSHCASRKWFPHPYRKRLTTEQRWLMKCYKTSQIIRSYLWFEVVNSASHVSLCEAPGSDPSSCSLTPLCSCFLCWASESSSPATVSSRSMDISTWVLTNIPALPPRSAIAMETQVSGLAAWCKASQRSCRHTWIYTDSSLIKEMEEMDWSFSLTPLLSPNLSSTSLEVNIYVLVFLSGPALQAPLYFPSDRWLRGFI